MTEETPQTETQTPDESTSAPLPENPAPPEAPAELVVEPAPVVVEPGQLSPANAPLPEPLPEEGEQPLPEEEETLPPAPPTFQEREAEALLYNPAAEVVRCQFSGVPYFLTAQDVTGVPVRAADLFVGADNTGGELYGIGVRRFLVPGERYRKVAADLGIEIEEYVHQQNQRIYREANAAYEAHKAGFVR